MHIAIEETGSFDIDSDRISCFGALAVRSKNRQPLTHDFITLKRLWGYGTRECKGSDLSEGHICQIIDLLKKYDSTYNAVIFDPFDQTREKIKEHRNGQVNVILAESAKDSGSSLDFLASDLLSLSPEEYVQVCVCLNLLAPTLQDILSYHAIRDSNELGTISWRIDTKNNQRLHDYVTKMAPPFVRTYLEALPKEELIYVHPETDYSAFQHSFGQQNIDGTSGYRLDLIFQNLKYCDSQNHPLLQLVDIVANAFGRGANGHLGSITSSKLGQLTVHKRGSIKNISFNGDFKIERFTQRPIRPSIESFLKIMYMNSIPVASKY